jgi:SAM-dependent methyltransferase
MLARAAARGIQVVQGVAEALPFGDATFAIALVNTAVCFMDDVEAAFAEAARVLMPGGRLVVGMIDGDSWLGRRYRAEAARDVFYAAARFRSVAEVRARMADAALTHVGCAQTVFQAELPGRKATDVTSGSGRGGYAVVCGERASMRRMP